MEHEIFNHRHYRDFTIIPNEILQATDIPVYTLGILCHLLSLPDSWVINIGALARRFGDSETKISRALKDLIALGYCKRTPKRGLDGKVCGQRYQITDIRNDFSDPSIFRGAEKETAYAENTDSAKNDGVYKKYNNKKNIYINNQEKNKGETPHNSHDEPLCLFENSRFAEFDKFAEQFQGDDYAGVDIRYYYEVVKNWSAGKRAKKNNWIATARGIMLRDHKDGKLARLQPSIPDWQQDMILTDRALDDDSLWGR